MKKVMRLVSIQLWASMGNMLSLGNSSKKKPKALYTGLVFLVIMLGGVAFFYSYFIGSGLKMYDSIEILPALMMAVTSAMVLLTTVFKVKGTIFGFKDYDMVMSMPVSTGGIAVSRLILLYCVNMLFVVIVMIPMMIAYGILVKPSILFYLVGFFTLFFIPLIPIIIASFLGTIITYVASKFRHSNFMNILMSIGFFVAIIGLSFSLGKSDSGQELVNISWALTDQVNSIYPLAGMYTKAVCNYDVLALLSFLAISFVAFLLYSFIIGKVFKRINTSIMTGTYRSNYKMGELSQSSQGKALYVKELKRYFSSTIYVLNTGFGIVILTISTIALIFVDLQKLLNGQMSTQMLVSSGPMFISFCIVTCCTTMASISLEGKNLWVIKSSPVTPKTIFLAKIAVNLTVIAPALIDAVLICIILKFSILHSIVIVLVIMVCAAFTILFGLIVNLKLPNFNWTTEVAVVKQSAAAMIAIFTGMGIVGLQFVLLYFISSFYYAYVLYICLMAIVDIALYKVLMVWGQKRFTTL